MDRIEIIYCGLKGMAVFRGYTRETWIIRRIEGVPVFYLAHYKKGV